MFEQHIPRWIIARPSQTSHWTRRCPCRGISADSRVPGQIGCGYFGDSKSGLTQKSWRFNALMSRFVAWKCWPPSSNWSWACRLPPVADTLFLWPLREEPGRLPRKRIGFHQLQISHISAPKPVNIPADPPPAGLPAEECCLQFAV